MHRVAPLAERDLDDIWYFVAKESGGVDVANRLIDTITDRFYLLARFPHMGRFRGEDFGAGSRSFGVGEYVIAYGVEGEEVVIFRLSMGGVT